MSATLEVAGRSALQFAVRTSRWVKTRLKKTLCAESTR